MNDSLIGDRVELRRMKADDEAMVVAWRNQSEVAAQMFSATLPTIESHRRWFAAIQEAGDRHEFIIVEKSTQRPIGTIGLSAIDSVNRRAEYGALIGEASARGQGYAFEASHLLLRYAFSALDLHRVYLRVFATNSRALSLYEQLGFQREGTLRQHVLKDEYFHDVVMMGILRDDYHE